MEKKLIFLFCFLLASTVYAGEEWRFTILHTNDLHGMMMPFDYPQGEEGSVVLEKDVGGLARRATAIFKVKAETPGPLALVDVGDIFTRGPWHERFFGVPEIETMNMMQYDVMTVGNNEFKATGDVESQKIFLSLMRRSRFPWLAANLTVGDTKLPLEGIHPFVVRTYGSVRVGFIGLTAPRSAAYPQTKGWTISDPIEAAKTFVPAARKECDILIAVTHIGVIADASSALDIPTDNRLAAEVDGIDAIIGGDSHTFLEEPLAVRSPSGRTVPIVQAGEQGIRLGKLDLLFEKKEGRWILQNYKGELIPIDHSTPENLVIKTFLDRILRSIAPTIQFPGGRFKRAA